MTALMLLYRRDPRNAAQLARAVARFHQRTGRTATHVGVSPGAAVPAGAAGLAVVEDARLRAAEFFVGAADA